MNNLFGWNGKILRIDLSSSEVDIETLSKEVRKKYIGGMGLGAKIMWDEIAPETDPLEAKNKLIFLPGPLTGTLAPTSGRMEVCTKAPGIFPYSCTRSGIGGSIGAEIKYAGYDGIIVQGKAEKPVILLINDKKVEIKDATDLWGKDTFVTQKMIMEKYGSEYKIVCIGPAGENLVNFSAIMSETGHSAAKAGMGAVMGSKKLKAIAVKGSNGVKVAKEEEFINLCRTARKLILNHPVKKWSTQGPIPGSKEFVERNRKRYYACYACPAACRSWIEMPGMEPGEVMCLGSFYVWLGANDRDTWEAKVLSDKLGLCQYTLYDLIRWLQKCYKAGIINEKESGIPWSKIGTSEFINIFLSKITYREGFGDLLAKGGLETAKYLGDAAIELYNQFFYARNQAHHYPVRAYPVVLLQWATDNRDPLSDAHDWICLVHWAGLYWPRGLKGALTPKLLKARAKDAYGTEEAANPFSYKEKAKVTITIQNMSRLKNSLVLCDWSMFPILSSPNMPPDYRGDPDMERKLYIAATGIEINREEWMKTGERIFTLERAIMAREGRRKEDDAVADYYFKVPEKPHPWEPESTIGKVADVEKFKKMREEYYKLRGFDPITGIPTEKKLLYLGLEDIVEDLKQRDII